MKYKVFDEDELVTEIDVVDKKVTLTNYTSNILKRPFGVKEEININDLNDFFKVRCLPSRRVGLERFLKSLNLGVYDTLDIIERTNGFMAEDRMWIQHEGEAKTWQEVRDFNLSL